MFSSSKSRGSLAMRHVLDKYSSIAGADEEEDGIPFDQLSNADFDMPPMGLSPVSNMIKRISVVAESKSTKEVDKSTPRSANRAKNNLRRTIFDRQGKPGETASQNFDENSENRPAESKTREVSRKLSSMGLSSSTELMTEQPAARNRLVDLLDEIRIKRSSRQDVPLSLLQALRSELDSLAESNGEASVAGAYRQNSAASQNKHVAASSMYDQARQSTAGKVLSEVRENDAPRTTHGTATSYLPRPSVLSSNYAGLHRLSSLTMPNTTAVTKAAVAPSEPEIIEDESDEEVEQEFVRMSMRCQYVEEGNNKADVPAKPTHPLTASKPPHKYQAVNNLAVTTFQQPRQSVQVEDICTSEHVHSNPAPSISEPVITSKAKVTDQAGDGVLSMETTLPDLIKYQLQAKLLECGMDHSSENFSRASRWAYYQVATDVNSCISDGTSVHYCCLKRVIATMARVAATLFNA